ncbi:MAG: hypothetical protein J7K29_05670, partial [Candidatus Cloacimonetes bacterium]|nr:hypothetical protein [Candidatus Cloacimonadota bacterium]
AGDIVDNGNHVYARIAAGGEATWDLTKWQIADSSGRLHSDASRYLVGDIVSYGGKLYVNSTAITTAKPWDPADWTSSVIDTWIGLSDTPAAYIQGGTGRIVVQNNTDDGTTFTDTVDGGTF